MLGLVLFWIGPHRIAVRLLPVYPGWLVLAPAARAIGAVLPLDRRLPVALPVLIAMLIPLWVAGWGWREATTGALWSSLGQAPARGIAVCIACGAVVTVGATPGELVWLRRPTPGATPRPTSESAR